MNKDIPELYLENQLCFPLYAASRLTTKIYTPYLEELGITYPQYLVMLTLWQHGKQSIKSIGEKLYLESNTLTPLLKRLEQKKLTKKIRSITDERTVIISLTTEGNDLKNKAMEIPNKIIESFGQSDLSKNELDKFHKTLFRILNTLYDRSTKSKK